MKVAVATDDFVSITGHVGRCNGFLIFDIENNKVMDVEQRENNFTHHKTSTDHSHSHGHSHTSLIEGLSDCKTLICSSAGWRLQDDFKSAGKELVFTEETLAEEAALKYSNGTLVINTDGACHAH